MASAVDIDTESLDVTIAGFEKSGGAYVVSTVCRARGILRKCVDDLPRRQTDGGNELDPGEVQLLLLIQQTPERVLHACAGTFAQQRAAHVSHRMPGEDLAPLFAAY